MWQESGDNSLASLTRPRGSESPILLAMNTMCAGHVNPGACGIGGGGGGGAAVVTLVVLDWVVPLVVAVPMLLYGNLQE